MKILFHCVQFAYLFLCTLVSGHAIEYAQEGSLNAATAADIATLDTTTSVQLRVTSSSSEICDSTVKQVSCMHSVSLALYF